MASVRGILLFAPYDLDTHAVNRLSGRGGYGHVAIANGESDALGRALAIDSSLGRGVFRRPIEMIADGRPGWHIITIGHLDLDDAYEAAMQRIGSPYNYSGLLGRSSVKSWTCSQLIYDCLPTRVRECVRSCGPWPLSPNCIARCLRGE